MDCSEGIAIDSASLYDFPHDKVEAIGWANLAHLETSILTVTLLLRSLIFSFKRSKVKVTGRGNGWVWVVVSASSAGCSCTVGCDCVNQSTSLDLLCQHDVWAFYTLCIISAAAATAMQYAYDKINFFYKSCICRHGHMIRLKAAKMTKVHLPFHIYGDSI